MIKLSVNINKVATLRNARGGDIPNLLEFAKTCQQLGADGITIHPRPDQRHIRIDDVWQLKEIVYTEFNIEGYPSPEFLRLVTQIKPTQVTLVPDPPHVLTSNAGWQVSQHKGFLTDIIAEIKQHGSRVSLFIEPDETQIKCIPEIKADRIELYTEAYAKGYRDKRTEIIKPYREAAQLAHQLGIGINAGHDLNLDNLHYFATHVPNLLEVSIGHALIADALYKGIDTTIKLYKHALALEPAQ